MNKYFFRFAAAAQDRDVLRPDGARDQDTAHGRGVRHSRLQQRHQVRPELLHAGGKVQKQVQTGQKSNSKEDRGRQSPVRESVRKWKPGESHKNYGHVL